MITIVAKNFVGGVWHEGDLDLSTVNPANLVEIAGQAHSASPDDVAYAVKVAQKGLQKSCDIGPGKRADLIDSLVQPMRRYAHEIAKYLTHECGYTLKESQDEVLEAIRFCQFMAGRAALDMANQTSWYPGGRQTRFMRKPVGVVACLSGWREPFAGSLKMALPAIVAGNTVIIKASEHAIAIHQWLARLILESGLGEGLMSVIHGPDDVVGELLARDPGVHTVLGDLDSEALVNYRSIVANRAFGNVYCTPSGLNGLVVYPDANVEEAAQLALIGAFGRAGQSWNSTKVAWVPESLIDAFVAKVDDGVKHIRIIDGLAEEAGMGPVCHKAVLDRFLGNISGIEGEVISQGARFDDETRSQGLFVKPHIVYGAAKADNVCPDGPSLLILPLDSVDLFGNGVRLNSLAIATKSIETVHRVKDQAKYNRLLVNCPTTSRLAPNFEEDIALVTRTQTLGIDA